MKSLSEWSVRNGLLVNLLTVFVIVAGVMALMNNRREAFPNFSFDVVQVRTHYQGATPAQIEKLITIPIEKELKEVDDIKEMVSASIEGMSLIYLVIEPDAANKDKTVNDIQRAVDRAEDLPEDLKEKSVVEEFTTKNTPMLEVTLYGDMSDLELRRQARLLEAALLDDPNVAKVTRRGYREPEYSVEVDPDKMAHYHLSLSDVMRALSATNVNIPGGDIREGGQEFLLRISGEYFAPEEILDVVIRSNDAGFAVKVRDVGKVIPTLEKVTVTNRTDGAPSVNLQILKRDRSDVIDLVRDVRAIIADFQAKAPPELKIGIVDDVSYYVERRLKVLINNALIGLVLLMIPLLVFLTPRTALSAALGIPTAVMATFAMMHFFGITINLMSLFGLIMVSGMLVDEDIVIAENVHRLMEEGMPPKQAAVEGTKQVASSVVATVLTTITAFAPLLFMTGIFGKFVKQIPQVVIITLCASLVQALVVLPSHIYDLNKMSEDEARKHFDRSSKHRLMNGLLAFYDKTLRFLISRRYLATLFFTLLMVGTFAFGYLKIPFILFPAEGIEQFFVRVEGDVGTPVEVTTERMQAIEKVLMKLPKNELDHFVTMGGITQNDPTDPFTNRASHVGQIWVFLTPETERQRTAHDIIESLRPEVEKIEGFKKVYFDNVRPGPPVGKPVAIRVKGDDFAVLDKLAQEYVTYLNTLPGVKDVKSDYEPGKSELRAQIDVGRMSQAGLTYQDVAAAVRASFEGGIATTIKQGDEEIDVVVRFPEEIRRNKTSLQDVLISNREGRLIPLKQIATFEVEPALSMIKHDDRKRLISVTANVDEAVTTSRKVNAALGEHFKNRIKEFPGVLVKYGGEEEDTQESLDSLIRAMVLAIFLTFIIIAATFRSLWEPLVILTTIPMGMMGVVYGFYLFGEPLGFLATLGIIGFVGVIVDGALLIIEFINQEKAKGLAFKEAIVRGSKARLRPIILTTATTVLGIVPSAFGIGGTDPFIQPMAFAMNWGLAVGTFLAVLFIPVFLAVLDDVFGRFRRKESAA
ncbi:MAG: efflux RND transporter permease subunit [Deltaproteobacteria bacterium]|nr:efflux RND transporter permease subunit [Deltaproteobacteria bacterium]